VDGWRIGTHLAVLSGVGGGHSPFRRFASVVCAHDAKRALLHVVFIRQRSPAELSNTIPRQQPPVT
jgi:hypothetical protein